MTAAEMVIGVNLGVQKVDSNAFDDILDEESLYYLNKAQREFIRRQLKYLKVNLQGVSREDAIQQTKSNDNLHTLLVNEHIDKTKLSKSTIYTNANTLNLSSLSHPVYTIIGGQTRANELSSYITMVEINSAQIGLYAATDSNNPIFRNYPYIKIADQLYVFYDYRGEVYDLTLLYIKKPLKLVLNVADSNTETDTSELPEHTHDDIVNLATTMILEDLKSARPYEQNQTTIPNA